MQGSERDQGEKETGIVMGCRDGASRKSRGDSWLPVVGLSTRVGDVKRRWRGGGGATKEQ